MIASNPLLLKVHFPFWIIFSLKKFQSIAASKLVEKHWSKWIIKWVILHIGWVTLTQVVAQSKSFESAWGQKLKNTVREKCRLAPIYSGLLQINFTEVGLKQLLAGLSQLLGWMQNNESDKDTFCWVWIPFLLFLLVDYSVPLYGVSCFTETISMLLMVNPFWYFYLARHALFSLFHFSDGLALINIILDFWNFIFRFALLYSLLNYFSAFSPSPIQHKYFHISPLLCTPLSTVRSL